MTTRKPIWLRIAQFPLLRLVVFGTVMFYMLGYSNNFIGKTAGNPLLQIAVVIGWAAVGFAVYTACILILMAFGIYKVEGLNPVSYLPPAIALPLSSGTFEELLFRGVLFRIVEEWLASWISLVVSSLVFGLVHLMNPASTLLGAIFINVEAGILLAAAYMLTKSSVIAFLLCTATGVILLIMAARRGRIVPPFWKHGKA